MDKTALVEKNIEDGKRLIEALDETELKVKAALWFYLVESDEWRFIIASPLVDEDGPKRGYYFIQYALLQLSPPANISLENVSVLSPKNDLIKLLKTVIHTGPGTSGIRFKKNVINNQLIEDAYIYRMR